MIAPCCQPSWADLRDIEEQTKLISSVPIGAQPGEDKAFYEFDQDRLDCVQLAFAQVRCPTGEPAQLSVDDEPAPVAQIVGDRVNVHDRDRTRW